MSTNALLSTSKSPFGSVSSVKPILCCTYVINGANTTFCTFLNLFFLSSPGLILSFSALPSLSPRPCSPGQPPPFRLYTQLHAAVIPQRLHLPCVSQEPILHSSRVPPPQAWRRRSAVPTIPLLFTHHVRSSAPQNGTRLSTTHPSSGQEPITTSGFQHANHACSMGQSVCLCRCSNRSEVLPALFRKITRRQAPPASIAREATHRSYAHTRARARTHTHTHLCMHACMCSHKQDRVTSSNTLHFI